VADPDEWQAGEAIVVEARGAPVIPTPDTNGAICPNVVIAGYIATLTVAPDGAPTLTGTSPTLLCSVVVGACASREKTGVDEANGAEGHVTVARPRSTTPSARHQVENRWNMLLQATPRHDETMVAY